MRKRFLSSKRFIASALFIGIAGVGVWSQFLEKRPEQLENLTIATVHTEVNALFYVADAQGLFAANGLNAILKEEYDSGAAATAGLLKGEADISSAAEFLIAKQVFNKKEIINLGTITKYENTYVVWRADSGIKSVGDLKGKRVGVTMGTISEFYIGRELELSGVGLAQVEFIDTKAADAEIALVNGEVDAVVTWEPWVTQIKEHLGNAAIITPSQCGQYAYWNLVSTKDWANKHPETAVRLLRSLFQAEAYIASHPAEAKAIVKKRMNFENALIDNLWDHYQFTISLDQSLILTMEDEARWMIENKLTTAGSMPNFLNYIYFDALEKVSPKAVTIIH